MSNIRLPLATIRSLGATAPLRGLTVHQWGVCFSKLSAVRWRRRRLRASYSFSCGASGLPSCSANVGRRLLFLLRPDGPETQSGHCHCCAKSACDLYPRRALKPASPLDGRQDRRMAANSCPGPCGCWSPYSHSRWDVSCALSPPA